MTRPFLTLKDGLCYAVGSILLAALILALAGHSSKLKTQPHPVTSEDVATLARTVRVANEEDRAEKRLVSDNWHDDLSACNADLNCRAQVAALKPRRR